MTSPDPSTFDDQILVQYLLGQLGEADAKHLDELSVVDDEFAMRLIMAENDLVDAYVRSDLSEEILQRFRTFYLLSAKRREKVRFAANLLAFELKAVPAAGMSVEPKEQAGRQGVFAKSSWFSHFVFPHLGFVAATVMVLVASVLVVDNIRLRSHMKQEQADRGALQKRVQALRATLEEQHAANAETVKKLDQLSETLSLLEKHPTGNGVGARMPSPFSIASFVLSPQMRGSAQGVMLSLPPGTTRIDFRLELESDDFPQYRVALKDPVTRQILWRSGNLKAETEGQSSTVSIILPANLLKRQNYILELRGGRGNGDGEFLSSYTFTVGNH